MHDTPASPTSRDETPTFEGLGLPAVVVRQLDALGYEEPTAIQRDAVPVLLAGRDVVGRAATGTGKTAAFALPMIARLVAADAAGEHRDGPLGLVVVPTRELAMQVAQAIHTYGQGVPTRVLPVYGGQSIGRQIKRLQRGVDVVVATPGRAVDHLSRGTLRLDDVEVVVLDEADEMLDMGFAEDLDTILDATPTSRQTALFSATMPSRLQGLADARTDDPVRVTVDRDDADAGPAPRIREHVVVTDRHHKTAALTRVLDVEDPDATLVFCRTRNDVEDLARALASTGRQVRALHGGMDQQVRSRVLEELRTGAVELVVATDVASRGLDVDTLTHVVNHALPGQPEQYVHRIGRVGRAGREGVAITLVEPREARSLRGIERHVGRTLDVSPVPSVDRLRERRVEQLVDRVREAMLREDLPIGRRAFDELGGDGDATAIAMAALTVLAEEAAGEHDETDVPVRELRGGGRGAGRPGPGGDRGAGSSGGGRGAGTTRHRSSADETATVWLSVGRNVGVRPKDVVGAVCNEAGLDGSEVGEVAIMQRFTLVEVPADKQDAVVAALRGSTVRGKSVHAKPDRHG